MRIGEVIGQLTLSRWNDAVAAAQWKIVVPLGEAELREGTASKAEELIVYDELSVGPGQRIAFSEGVEAAMPFYPNTKPIDAYAAAVLDCVDIRSEI